MDLSCFDPNSGYSCFDSNSDYQQLHKMHLVDSDDGFNYYMPFDDSFDNQIKSKVPLTEYEFIMKTFANSVKLIDDGLRVFKYVKDFDFGYFVFSNENVFSVPHEIYGFVDNDMLLHITLLTKPIYKNLMSFKRNELFGYQHEMIVRVCHLPFRSVDTYVICFGYPYYVKNRKFDSVVVNHLSELSITLVTLATSGAIEEVLTILENYRFIKTNNCFNSEDISQWFTDELHKRLVRGDTIKVNNSALEVWNTLRERCLKRDSASSDIRQVWNTFNICI